MRYKTALLPTLALCLPCGLAQAQIIEHLDAPLVPEGIAPQSNLGWDISVRGDALVASSPNHFQGLVGEVWAFWKVNGSWRPGGAVQRSSPQAGDHFGLSIDADDQTLVVSAPAHPSGPRLYVFERSGKDWIETAILSEPGASSLYGIELAFEGDRIVAADRVAGETYVYERALGAWSLDQTLLGVNGPFDIEGDTLVATQDGVRAVVFERIQGSWTQVASFEPGGSPLAPALEQDLLIVPSSGYLHLHERISGSWVATGQLKSAIEFAFGQHSAAVHGDRIVAVSHPPGFGGDAWVSLWTREDAASNQGAEWSERKLYRVLGSKVLVRLEADFDGATLAVGNWNFNTPGSAVPTTGAVYATDAPPASTFFGDSFCHGDTSSCPCGFQTNWPGGPGCQGSTHGALLLGSGSTSVAADALTMSAFGLPSQVPSLLIWGPQASSAPVPFGNGLLCLAGPIQRTYVFTSDFLGAAEWSPGPSSFGPPGSIAAGDELSFQVWYRDPTAFCGNGFNLTNGFQVKFTP